MLNRLLNIVFWLLMLALLALGCWLIVMYRGWPLWAMLPLAVGASVLAWCFMWLRRRWVAWRLRRRLAKEMPKAAGADHHEFDRQWHAGIKVLREARMGGRTTSLYALPWTLSIDVGPVSSSPDYAHLAIRSLPYPGTRPGQGLGWYFLKSLVVLSAGHIEDSAGSDPESESAWQRLLYRLIRTRRREPLNAVVFNIDADWMLQAQDIDLVTLGRRMRERHDDVVRAFSSRIPVWFVLTHSEKVAGFSAWAELLEADLRTQPFGYMSGDQTLQHGSPAFLHHAFSSVANRMAELRLQLGMDGPLAPDAFNLPLVMARFESRFERLLVPSFESTSYAATPLLSGLYWVSSEQEEAVPDIVFGRALYHHVMPAMRYAWQPLDRFAPWRRLIRHTAAAGWIGLSGAAIFALFYLAGDVKHTLRSFSAHQLENLHFGDLNEDLQALNVWRDATAGLARSTQGLAAMLPFHSHISEVEQHYTAQFASLYKREILRDFLDGLVVESLPDVVRDGTGTDVAAWAQYLVRRINLIEAQMQGKNVAILPLPGAELPHLYGASRRHTIGMQTSVLVGQLYVDYLRWQPEPALLQSELDALRAALRQLALPQRSPDWLLAWAEFQNNVRPITLADFWNVRPDNDAPMIPAGLTKAGAAAISDFVLELAKASGDRDLWIKRHADLEERFRAVAYDAWYRFIAGFHEGRLYLQNEAEWRSSLTGLFSENDPYQKLMRMLSELFGQVPAAERPSWLDTAIGVRRVIQVAQQTGGAEEGLLDRARTANMLGHEGLREVREGATLEHGVLAVRDGMVAVDEMRAYREHVGTAISSLLQGEGSAMDLARQTWGFGHDPDVKSSPLHEATLHFGALRNHLQREGVRENAVWRLVQGPLLFTLDYASRSAACELQADWSAGVLSSVQGVRSPVLAHELLFSERGSVSAFMQGKVQSFIEKDNLSYRPRQALGVRVPLNGQFYAFASGVQLRQIAQMEAHLRDEQAERMRAADLENLQEKKADLEKEADATGQLTASVTIETAAALVNQGARLLPQRTSLSLQCAAGTTVLDNYNFPTSAVFDWAPDICGDTTVSLQFPGFVIRKVYEGADGFVRFLREFESGQRHFRAADFPGEQKRLEQAGVQSITLAWRIRGHQPLLANAEKRESTRAEIKQVAEQLTSLREALAAAPAQQTRITTAADIVPERIVRQCWRSAAPSWSAGALDSSDAEGPHVMDERVRAVYEAVQDINGNPHALDSQADVALPAPGGEPEIDSGAWYVQVGVFADPTIARQQLDGLGVTYDIDELERSGRRPLYSVRATGFHSEKDAKRAASKIETALRVKPLIALSAR